MNLNARQNKPRVSLSDRIPMARKRDNDLNDSNVEPNDELPETSHQPTHHPQPLPSVPPTKSVKLRCPPNVFRSRPKSTHEVPSNGTSSSSSSSTTAKCLLDTEESFRRMLHLLNLLVSEQNGLSMAAPLTGSKLVSKVRHEARTARLVSVEPLSLRVYLDAVVMEDRNGPEGERAILQEIAALPEYLRVQVTLESSSVTASTSRFAFHGSEVRTLLLNEIAQGFLPTILATAYEGGVRLEGEWFDYYRPTQEKQSYDSQQQQGTRGLQTSAGRRLGGAHRQPCERIFPISQRNAALLNENSVADETKQQQQHSTVQKAVRSDAAIVFLTPTGPVPLMLPAQQPNQNTTLWFWMHNDEVTELPSTATFSQMKEWLSRTTGKVFHRFQVGPEEWRVDKDVPVRDITTSGVVVRCT